MPDMPAGERSIGKSGGHSIKGVESAFSIPSSSDKAAAR